MHSFHISAKTDQATLANLPSIRFRPSVHLLSGDLVGAYVDLRCKFEDRPSFHLHETSSRISDWVADTLKSVCKLATEDNMVERPIVLPLPAASFGNTDIVTTCSNVMANSRLCPQEFCFELTDSALVEDPKHITAFFRSFRQRGFRIGVDARKSWQANIAPSTWLMVDTLRVTLPTDHVDVDLVNQIEAARAAGVAVVAEKVLWRDGERLADLGIEYALDPRTDA